MTKKTNDSFYADEDRVYRKPVKTDNGTSMGFRVLTVDEYVADPKGVAKIIAKLLNEYWEDTP